MDDLALKVSKINVVAIDDTDSTHTGCRKILKRGRAKPPCANNDHASVLKTFLPLQCNLWHDEVTAVPEYFFV